MAPHLEEMLKVKNLLVNVVYDKKQLMGTKKKTKAGGPNRTRNSPAAYPFLKKTKEVREKAIKLKRTWLTFKRGILNT